MNQCDKVYNYLENRQRTIPEISKATHIPEPSVRRCFNELKKAVIKSEKRECRVTKKILSTYQTY